MPFGVQGNNQTQKIMRKIFILFATAALFAACETQPVRYASSSPEIDIYLSTFQNFVDGEWNVMRSHYADTAMIFDNATRNNGETIDQVLARLRENRELFSSQYFLPEEQFVEMVVTDDGETWVNYWGVWVGVLAATDQRFETPIHFTAQFVDGKIVREHGYYDNSSVILALQGLGSSAPEE